MDNLGASVQVDALDHDGHAQNDCLEGDGELFLEHRDVVPSAAGGAILGWADHRGTRDDVYAQQISADGVLGATVASVPSALPHISLAVVSPSTGRMNLSCGLSRSSIAVLSLYDAAGRLVTKVDLGSPGAGLHQYSWETGAPAGLYVVKLTDGTETVSRKLVLLR